MAVVPELLKVVTPNWPPAIESAPIAVALVANAGSIRGPSVSSPVSLELADRLFAAIEQGRFDDLYELYAPDAVIWHNHDGVEQNRDDNVRLLRWVGARTNLRYAEVRREATNRGFVQQHVLQASNAAGTVQLAACIVVTVVDGRIARLDEYLDSRQVEQFRKLAMAVDLSG